MKPQSNGNFESCSLLFFDTTDVHVQSNLWSYRYICHKKLMAYYSTTFSVILQKYFNIFGLVMMNRTCCICVKNAWKTKFVCYLSVKARQHSGFSCWNCLWLYVIDYLIFCFSNVIKLFEYYICIVDLCHLIHVLFDKTRMFFIFFFNFKFNCNDWTRILIKSK